MRPTAEWLGLLLRLVVGGVWLVAGLLKLADPTANVRAVRAYQLLPESLVTVVGHGLPVLEILVGGCLLAGLLTRAAALVSAGLLAAFVIGIASAWQRGLSIECGCFGGGSGPAVGAQAKYPWEIGRDIGLLLLSAWLVWHPRTRWAADDTVLVGGAPSDAPGGRTTDTRDEGWT